MPDLDKLIRAILDALTGVVWRDDGQVVDIVASKVYADTPGVDVVIT
jgi:Holliday junction resolvase RusA-like endonuclease